MKWFTLFKDISSGIPIHWLRLLINAVQWIIFIVAENDVKLQSKFLWSESSIRCICITFQIKILLLIILGNLYFNHTPLNDGAIGLNKRICSHCLLYHWNEHINSKIDVNKNDWHQQKSRHTSPRFFFVAVFVVTCDCQSFVVLVCSEVALQLIFVYIDVFCITHLFSSNLNGSAHGFYRQWIS